MKKGSIKNTRINAEVRKEIQNVVMNGIKDPGGGGYARRIKECRRFYPQ